MTLRPRDASAKDTDDRIQQALDVIIARDTGGLAGAYLYGSSTTSGLGPESDIDLLLVTRRSLLVHERTALVAPLLGISGWRGHADEFPDVAHRRPVELTSLVLDDTVPLAAAPRRDFQFGEWLRRDLVRGSVPQPERDPDVVILLATALASSRALHGPPLRDLIPSVPLDLLREAQRAALPNLLEGLAADTRNVLLTLARMLHTVETGEIVSKPRAAALAAERVDADGADLLCAAAREYRGEERVDWDRESNRASALADSLVGMIRGAYR